MTIAIEDTKEIFAGNGSSTSFAFDFKTNVASDLQVVLTSTLGVESILALDAQYTVTLNSNQNANPGGTVLYPITGGEPLPAGETLTIVRAAPYTQPTAFTLGVSPKTLESKVDNLTMFAQQLYERAKRSLSISVSEADTNTSLGTAVQRANRTPTFDENGDLTLATSIIPGSFTQTLFNAFAAVFLATMDLGSAVAQSFWQIVNPRTAEEIAQGVVPVNYRYKADGIIGDARRYGYVADGVDFSDTGTNNTTALQNCINCNSTCLVPAGVGLFNTLTIPSGKTLRGAGTDLTILRQFSSQTTASLVLADIVTADISRGGQTIEHLWVKTAVGADGLLISEANASRLRTCNFKLWSQHAETLGSLPYDTEDGQIGINVVDGSVHSVLMGTHENLEIRSFDVGIVAGAVVNEWKFLSAWTIDCRVGVRLSGCSTWDLSGLTVESGVTAARAVQTVGAVSNITWMGGRWELTQADCYGLECDGSTTGSNWTFLGINVLISGDGSAIPGRKWTGAVPADVLFVGTDSTGRFAITPTVTQTFRLPARLTLGGQNLGNARVTLGRNAGSADTVIEHDGTHAVITAGNSLKLRGDGTGDDRLEINGDRVIVTGADGANGWEAAARFGANSYLWFDSTGDLRTKQGAPTSETDGTVVGTQT